MGACSNWQKFKLLLWKNWLLQWNHKIQFLLQIFLPILFALLLIFVRSLVRPTQEAQKNYPPREITTLYELQYVLEAFNKIVKMELAYSPQNKILENIISTAAHNLSIQYKGLTDSKSLEKYLTSGDSILAGAVFDESLKSITEYPKLLNYTLRFPSELRTNPYSEILTWMTNRMFPIDDFGGPRNLHDINGGVPSGYIQEGFIPIQHAISMAFIRLTANEKNIFDILPKVVLQRYPYPAFNNDQLLLALGVLLSLIIMLSFIYSCTILVKSIAIEKEKQLKEVMKIMGLKNWAHWSAWFVKSFVMLGFSIICLVIIIKSKFVNNVSILTYTSWSTIIFFLLVYVIATITFCFMLATFFSKASTAAAATGLVWFITFLPFLLTRENYETLSNLSKFGLSFLLNTGMGYAVKMILLFEGAGEGLQWSNMFTPVSVDDNLTVGYIILMLLLASILHMVICLYVEQIFPGEFGVRKVWYFPFTQNFWGAKMKYKEIQSQNSDKRKKWVNDGFEQEPTGKKIGLEVKNLRKVFKKKKAVQGVSLNMYEDEITVLLGHNGAGKTTTISMIIGMFPPTSGTAIINGKDIRTNTEAARNSLGICPQYNILFDELTVRHHIIFYSHLKGVRKDKINLEIDKYVKMLKLENKMNVASSKLSGGMKRKLSLCAALCGGTKVVLCDEPSSGLDPAARRQLWDLLQAEKFGRTILLTTHFMDEADVLGDRIAIMCDGKVKCHGTPFFLKKRFGSGYRLICEKRENCVSNAVTDFLQKYIPDLELENENQTELVYVLPDKYSKVFQEMFKDIENSSESLGINGFGISITSLEEVFLKVGAEKTFNIKDDNSKNYFKQISCKYILALSTYEYMTIVVYFVSTFLAKNFILIEDWKLLRSQWAAMFIKKYFYTIRKTIILAIQMLVPLMVVVFTMFQAKSNSFNELPPLKINLNSFGETFTVLETASNVFDGSVELKISDAYKGMMSKQTAKDKFIAIITSFEHYIINISKTSLALIKSKYIASATVSKDIIIAWFNNQPFHTAPLSLNLVHNAMVKGILGSSYNIEITNAPLPFTAMTKVSQLNTTFNLGNALALNLCFCMCFITAFYILIVITERACGAKLLQFVGGVKVCTFWLTQLIWDMFTFIITSIIVILTILCFQEDCFSTFAELGRIFLIFIIFGLAAMPVSYLVSYYFSEASTGFAVLAIFNLFTGVAFFIIFSVLNDEDLGTVKTAEKLKWFFMIFPHYCFASSLNKLYQNARSRKICVQSSNLDSAFDCKPIPFFGWEKPGVLPEVVYMIVCFIIIYFYLLIKEFRYIDELIFKLKSKNKNQSQPLEEEYYDKDVADEKMRVKNLMFDDDSDDSIEDDEDVADKKIRANNMKNSEVRSENVVLDGVTKYYGNFLAVNDISVCIQEAECFGLLGVNGAGKTTTFKMMTGDERITFGEAYICGYSVKSEMKEVYKEIGYCPQFDALLDDLTGRETLKIFCLLRGVPENRIQLIIRTLAKAFGFRMHLDKRTKAYSGGNKRKLSTAIAVIGSPSVIYLDEPTTGMDPAARRQLWNMITGIRNSGKSIVLTSHSMEECEALCTRLAIMVNGEFKCIGSTQHLKNIFSKGLVLKLKLKGISGSRTNLTAYDTSAVMEFVGNEFPEAVLQEQYQGILTFYIPLLSIKWSRIFGLMEENLERLNIEDYSVSQTTLEEIFLEFSKYQKTDPREINLRNKRRCWRFIIDSMHKYKLNR